MASSLQIDESTPLSELFARGAQISVQVESSSGKDDENARKNGIEILRRCEELVDALALFSVNEDADDISTGDLKYLLVAYHLGILLAATPENDPVLRQESLQEASNAYARFLRLAKLYKLVPKSAMVEEKQDANTERNLKVQRFKDLKQGKAALFALQAFAIQKKRKGLISEDGSNQDDEDERKIWLKQIFVATIQAVEQQGHISKEVELLKYAASVPASEREQPLPPPPADVLQKLQLAAKDLGSERATIAANVFKPSHNLPTRSLREQADIEIQQAKEASESQAKGEKLRKELEADEDYALQKARAWDDWKDDHQRGEGNSRSRPTA